MKPITMELGGHSPVIVFEDADVERAAKMLARFKIRNAGQVCISPTRFYIHQDIFEQFKDTFTQTLADIKVDDGLKECIDIGTLAHARLLTSMQIFVDDVTP